MLQAAYLVLDGEQHFSVVRIDYVLESILMLIAFLSHQPLFHETPIWA